MIYLIFLIIASYIGLLAFLYKNQRKLLYFPDKNIGPPEQYGLNGFREEFITTNDGISLQSWYKPAQSGFATIIYFHGNASHMGNRSGIYSALTEMGFGLFTICYRGYGKSSGSPSEQGLYIDARTALEYLNKSLSTPFSSIIIYGESLGTGVSVQMANEYPVAGLVLQAPYTSVSGRAAEIYFFIPVKKIIHDHYDSLSKIVGVKAPLLLLHGELDITIPIRHGKALFAAANEPKKHISYPEVGHNNFDSGAIAEEVMEFARANNIGNNNRN